MLSILPFEGLTSASSSTSTRDSDRPFKAYSSHHSTSLYPSAYTGHPAFLGSVLPGSSATGGRTEGMDLRTHLPYEHHPHHHQHHAIPSSVSAATAHQIKQEMDTMQQHYSSSYNGYHHTYPGMSQMSAMSNHLMGGAGSGNPSSAASSAQLLQQQQQQQQQQPHGSNGLGSLQQSSNPLNGTAPNGSHITDAMNGLNSPPASASNMAADSKASLHNLSSGSSPSNTHNSSDGASPSSRPPPSKKRAVSKVNDELKDDTYWEKRKKNNESAKRSREARRGKEEQIGMRVVYLEQENLQLRTEVGLLKTEIEKLRCMLYNS